ncbi:hypothetical protein [Carboxylicivirga sp. N1Y90]|uniref:hypothetical protein n=1 Tax=Carboxylicivirga fragile TaxID=3417571 RepID=UPI003D346847|nr:hypothetical protein [Marinilabiliaceae bacterium N1Y90]
MVLNNYLLIAGNGRNVGKTWLSELCIRELAKQHDVIALKIASHAHAINEDIEQLAGKNKQWMIGLETNRNSSKDSARMLKAGAALAYYAQLNNDAFLPDLLQWLKENIKADQPVICESSAIGRFIKPGLAFYVEDHSNSDKTCAWDFPFSTQQSQQNRIINPPSTIRWEKNSWQIK